MATTAPPITPPVTLAQQYESELRRLILDPIHRDITNRVMKAGDSYEQIRKAIRSVRPRIPVSTLNKLATTYYAALKGYHKRKFTRNMRRFLGSRVDVMGDQALRPVMQQRLHENVDLIKTIPARHLGPLENDVVKLAATRAFDQSALSNVLAHRYHSSGYNLRRITRDQTNKAIGDLTEARHRQAGITHYRWQTSEDERVRPTHEANNGRTFAWDDPPDSTGHPGDDILCRCTAVPVLTRALSIPRSQLQAGAAEAAPYPTHKRVAKALNNVAAPTLLRLAGFWKTGRIPTRDVAMGLINLQRSPVVEPVDFLTGMVGVQARRESVTARQLVAGALNLREDQGFAGQLVPGLFGLEKGARTITREQLVSTLAKRKDILARPFVPRGDVTRTDLWLNILGYRRAGSSAKARKTKAEAAARALGQHGRAPVTPKEMLLSLIHLDIQDMDRKDLILGLFGARRIVADLDSGNPAKAKRARSRLKAIRKAKLQGAVGFRAATRSLMADAAVGALDKKTRRQPISRMEWVVGMMLLKPQLPREWALALRRVQRTTEFETQRKVRLAEEKAYWEQAKRELEREDAEVNVALKRKDVEVVEDNISDLRGQVASDAFYRLDSQAREIAHQEARSRVVEDLRRELTEKQGVTFQAQMTMLEREFGDLTEEQRGVLEGRLPPSVLSPGPASQQATAFGLSPEDVLMLKEQGITPEGIEEIVSRRSRSVGVGGRVEMDPDAGERARENVRNALVEEAQTEQMLRSVQGSRFALPGPAVPPEVAEDAPLMRVLNRRGVLDDEQREDLSMLYDDHGAWRGLREANNEVAEAVGELNVDVLDRYETAQARLVTARRGFEDRSRMAEESGVGRTADEILEHREALPDEADVADLMAARAANPGLPDDDFVPEWVPAEEREAYSRYVNTLADGDTEDVRQSILDLREAIVRREELDKERRLGVSMEQDTVELRRRLAPYIRAAEEAPTDEAYREAVDNLLDVYNAKRPARRELPSEVEADRRAVERLRGEREAKANASMSNASAFDGTRQPGELEALEREALKNPKDFAHAMSGLRSDVGGNPDAFRQAMKEKGTQPAAENVAEQVILGTRRKVPRRGQREGVAWWPPQSRQDVLNSPDYKEWLPLHRKEQQEWLQKTRDPAKQIEQSVKIKMGEDPWLAAADRKAEDYRKAVENGQVPQPIEVLREYAKTTRHFGQEETPVGERALENLVQRYEKIGFTKLRDDPEVREMLRLEREPWELSGADPAGEYAKELAEARKKWSAGAAKPEAALEYNMQKLLEGKVLETVDLPRPAPVGVRVSPRQENPEEAARAVDKLNESRRSLDNSISNLKRDYAELEAEVVTKEGADFLTNEQREEIRGKLIELDTRQRQVQHSILEHDRVVNKARSEGWDLEVPDLRPAVQPIPAEDRSAAIARQLEGLEFQRSVQSKEMTTRINKEYELEIERRVGQLREPAPAGVPQEPWNWKEELQKAASRERASSPQIAEIAEDLRAQGIHPPKVLGYEALMKEYRLMTGDDPVAGQQARERLTQYHGSHQQYREHIIARAETKARMRRAEQQAAEPKMTAEEEAARRARPLGPEELPSVSPTLEQIERRHAAVADPIDPQFYRKAAELAKKPEGELTLDETAHLLTARERIAEGEYRRAAASRGQVPRVIVNEGEGLVTPGAITTGGEGTTSGLPGGYRVVPEHHILEPTHPFGKVSPLERRTVPPAMEGYPEDPGGPYGAGVTDAPPFRDRPVRGQWDPVTMGWKSDPDPTWMDTHALIEAKRRLEARRAITEKGVAGIDSEIAKTDDEIAALARQIEVLEEPNAIPLVVEGRRGPLAHAREEAHAKLLGLRMQRRVLESRKENLLNPSPRSAK